MKWHGSLVVVAAFLCAHGAVAESKKVETTTRSFSGGSPSANSRKIESGSKPEAIDLRAQASIEEAQKETELKKSHETKKVRRSFSGGNGLASSHIVPKNKNL